MALVVNHNLMAMNAARNLNTSYNRLSTSTQRLSSGLRINSAADDAAGLAIRELMRADIASLNQGVRNANDAISLIQVADGALQIIDEKLIRMKELAEQAATGTYNSTQRLMIESEYQAMASEITRIANATDFNGVKLLDGTLSGDHDGRGINQEGNGLNSLGELKVHFGTGNDSAEDYYYIRIGSCTASSLGLGNASAVLKYNNPTADGTLQGDHREFNAARLSWPENHGHVAGHNISTQSAAQQALNAINEAIVSKDKIRAHLGALQNRLENTISNLQIQAENLQAAESQISDVDVATEMTEFVRNQVLTQAGVAMLAQANSLPQMAMQLIGG